MESETVPRQKSTTLFTITGQGLAWYIIPFPAVGFVVCVILALIYDFEGSTGTHCRVPNYLPSISAATGGGPPQVYIWRICIGLHSAPRLMVAIIYYNHYQTFYVVTRRWLYDIITKALFVFHILENFCLVLLSFISSKENYGVHEKSFVGFMIFSELYMILTIIVFKWSRTTVVVTETDRRSFRYKVILATANISMFLAAIFVYFRHNKYCEPGMWTLFCALEYGQVITNICFHGTVYGMDLSRVQVKAGLGLPTPRVASDSRDPLWSV